MDESVMRAQVTQAYPGAIWAQKVKKMAIGQLYATWIRLKRAGKIS